MIYLQESHATFANVNNGEVVLFDCIPQLAILWCQSVGRHKMNTKYLSFSFILLHHAFLPPCLVLPSRPYPCPPFTCVCQGTGEPDPLSRGCISSREIYRFRGLIRTRNFSLPQIYVKSTRNLVSDSRKFT